MTGKSYAVERRRRAEEINRSLEPDFENFELDIRLAEAVVVRVGKGSNTLGWVARNRPAYLEQLMDKTIPGTPLFAAISKVYNTYAQQISAKLAVANAATRVYTTMSLAAKKLAKGETLPRVSVEYDLLEEYVKTVRTSRVSLDAGEVAAYLN